MALDVNALDHCSVCCEWTLDQEGHWSDHKRDRGGATMFGIASKRWPNDFAAMMALPPDKRRAFAIEFYRREFWTPLRVDLLPNLWVKLEIFDTAINTGRKTAVILAQKFIAERFTTATAAGVNPGFARPSAIDGDLGPITAGALTAIYNQSPWKCIAGLNSAQLIYYWELYKNDPEGFGPFLFGWLERQRMPLEFYRVACVSLEAIVAKSVKT